MRLVHGSHIRRAQRKRFTVHSFKESVYCLLLTVNCRRRGFSLIELLVVISIFAIMTGLVTAGYSGFEARERNKNAAETLKNDIRYLQNQANSGVKDSNCAESSKLVTWYVDITANGGTSYSIGSICDNNPTTSPAESVATYKTITLPANLNLTSDTASTHYYIFFQPLKNDPYFYITSSVPSPFLANLNLDPTFTFSNCCASSGVNIYVNGPGSTAANTVKIAGNGAVQ